MAVFSVSRIGTYGTCPLQYKYAYIDHVEVEAEDTVETFLGQRVHQALEKLYRDKQHEKLLSLEEWLVYFNKIWRQQWKDSIIIVKKEYTPENYRGMGERYLSNYYRRHKPFDRGRVLGLETKDVIPLDENGEYQLHIRIDRLVDMGDGLYEVHDYKTSSSLPRPEDLEADRQLAIYAYWVKRRFKDFRRARLVWHFLAFDREMESWKKAEELEKTREEILARVKEIEAAREFLPVVSGLCDWCVYKSICPMWKHGVEIEPLSENEYLDDPGVKLVDEYVKTKNEYDEFCRVAEEKMDKLKQALIAFCQREEVSVVFGSESKIAVKEQELVKFPAKNTEEREKLIAALRRIGKWDDVAELDTFALARVLKKKEWAEPELEVLKNFEILEKIYRLSVAKK
jgi:putative RecB family exonuclease